MDGFEVERKVKWCKHFKFDMEITPRRNHVPTEPSKKKMVSRNRLRKECMRPQNFIIKCEPVENETEKRLSCFGTRLNVIRFVPLSFSLDSDNTWTSEGKKNLVVIFCKTVTLRHFWSTSRHPLTGDNQPFQLCKRKIYRTIKMKQTKISANGKWLNTKSPRW